MQQITAAPPAKFGLFGFILGIASLVAVVIQLSVFFEPQEKSAGTVIGEIAADLKQSAARAFSGEPALETTPPPPDYLQVITAAAICAAGIAVVRGGYRIIPKRAASPVILGHGFWRFGNRYALCILACHTDMRGSFADQHNRQS
jgi:hypothetical protein